MRFLPGRRTSSTRGLRIFRTLHIFRTLRTLRTVLCSALALSGSAAQADIYRSLDPHTPTLWTRDLPTEGRWERYFKEQPAAVQVPPAPIREEALPDEFPTAVHGASRYATQIQAAAIANNVEAALIRAVISVESGYNPFGGVKSRCRRAHAIDAANREAL